MTFSIDLVQLGKFIIMLAIPSAFVIGILWFRLKYKIVRRNWELDKNGIWYETGE